jgi:hypothetical protein
LPRQPSARQRASESSWRARGLSRRDVEVRAGYDTRSQRAARVSAIRLTVNRLNPVGLPDREGVREVLNQCTIVNSPQQQPKLVIELRFHSDTNSGPNIEGAR